MLFTAFVLANLLLGRALSLSDPSDPAHDSSDNWLAYILNNQDAETRDSLSSNPSTLGPQHPAKPREYHICVTLNPARVSSRNGPYVTYECFAQICSNDLEGVTIAPESVEEYRFQRPLFDWNSQFSHLVVNNGTCSADSLTCWNRIELNIDSFTDSMESTGVQELEVRCRVADYTKNYESFNFVTGEATSVLRHFKGIAFHEPCNRTEDCGENLLCVPPSTQDPKSYGYCECSTTTIESGEIGSVNAEMVKARSFVLVEDEDYRETLCLEVAQINQTCRFDQQCRAGDPESACRPSTSLCDCVNGLDASSLFPRCLASSNSSDFTIWWFFPPISMDSNSAFYYYSHRYQTLYRIASVFLVFIVMLLLMAVMMAIIICITRKRHSRQYSPRRMSNSSSVTLPASDQSFYFPALGPLEHSRPTLDLYRCTPASLSLDMFGKTKTEDKLDLVDHDQLGNDKSP